MLLIRCYKDSYFLPDGDKYIEYENILKRTGYGQLCREHQKLRQLTADDLITPRSVPNDLIQ